jgi:molybdenum cofactor cytidylyltransferase
MDMRIGLVLLAARDSMPVAEAKQFLHFRGMTLFRQAVNVAVASGCCPITVVLGENANRHRTELKGVPVRIAHNPSWQLGIGSSIRTGVDAIQKDVDALIIMLADQPGVDDLDLHLLASKAAFCDKGVVVSKWNGKPGLPAVFTRKYFPALLKLADHEGVEKVIAEAGDDRISVSLSSESDECNTSNDYVRLYEMKFGHGSLLAQ